MADLREIAHRAALVAEHEATQLPCENPANNLLYAFLLEFKKDREKLEYIESSDSLIRNLQIALASVKLYPLRIYDVKSAQDVKGIGPSISQVGFFYLFCMYVLILAQQSHSPPLQLYDTRTTHPQIQLIRDGLFKYYPPDQPTEAEIESLRKARAHMQKQQAEKKKRQAQDELPIASLTSGVRRRNSDSQTTPRARSHLATTTINKDNTAATAAAAAAAAPEQTQNPTNRKKKSKTSTDYVPGIGTANYAFLICLFQAQRGPERLEYLTKDQLMDRAEASGLSNKPIRGEANPATGFTRQNSRQFYSGWSGFKTIENKGLVAAYSSPKRIKLTLEGLALAERLYRDAVARGRASAVLGLPTDGPLQYQCDTATFGGSVGSGSGGGSGSGIAPMPSAALRAGVARMNVQVQDRPRHSIGSGSGSDRCINTIRPLAAAAASRRVPSIQDEQVQQPEEVEVLDLVTSPPQPQLQPHPQPRAQKRRPPTFVEQPATTITTTTTNGGHIRSGSQSNANQRPPTSSRLRANNANNNITSNLALPPLSSSFFNEYEIILLVDEREQYASTNSEGSRSVSLSTHLARMQQAGLVVEQRLLPIGDALWIARQRSHPREEYVLDYILERKSIIDLLQSIKDSNRYVAQKYVLKRCGLRHLYYLVEGDPNIGLGSARDVKIIKSAMASTEIGDGFRVMRTQGIQETFRLYFSMTQAIIGAHRNVPASASSTARRAMTFEEFKGHVKEQVAGTTTLHDVWGRMLFEIPGLGPETVAMIVEAYPTPWSLWEAYKGVEGRGGRVGGGVEAAEGLLCDLRASGKRVGPEKSKKVYRLLFSRHQQGTFL